MYKLDSPPGYKEALVVAGEPLSVRRYDASRL
jgi:hypothetical protein